MQLHGDERKAFIAEEMDKLRNLQAEERERETRLQAEEREREGDARLQATEREKERVSRLQAEENENGRQAVLKIEELQARVEIEKICAQAKVKPVGGAAEGTTGIYADQVRPKIPKLPAFVHGKDDPDLWLLDSRLLHFERFASTSGWRIGVHPCPHC